ncbi:efflux transporter outer membrane subunit [Methyloversatilis sp. XJ19-13]|uniref:efflux transporter outer membrane subunit n=1 Tax=Methyloversatilis sp. XJ19-13 TaxID=2963430 RepID=UPI00211B86F5|nr:efflux transporter outer membrane subunit [Methyloversatilis sp. XJ19-13]MCQ9374805.1 efflux transporter outer membrane subunit [Methyloversatilis sp. XJ19-13]
MRLIDPARRGALGALLAASLLSACSLMPKPAPELDLPSVSATTPVELDRWWESFRDPVLDGLIAEALARNDDMVIAAQRVQASQATLDLVRINRLPDANLSLSGSRQQFSNERPIPNRPRQYNTAIGGFNASYELDLFGRLSGQRDVARQQLASSRYALEALRASISAQVARAYFNLRALDADEALLAQTLTTRESALSLRDKQFAGGAISRYDLELARSERAGVAASLASTRSAREQAETALSVLLGRSPRELVEKMPDRGLALSTLAVQPEIPSGLTSDLLARRADVRAAEANLAAASLSVEVARTQWMPTISLTAALGGESATLGNLLSASARTWSVGAAIAQPLVGLLSTRALVAQSEAERAQIAQTYQQAVRQAYADALGALSAARGAREAMEETVKLANATRGARDLAELSFNAGNASRIVLLDAERERLSAERQLIASRLDRVTALVNTYQALGGGWSGRIETGGPAETLENTPTAAR